MDDARSAGIVALIFVAIACLTVYFVGVNEPTGSIVDFLFPRL